MTVPDDDHGMMLKQIASARSSPVGVDGVENGTRTVGTSALSRDEADLAYFGKRQQLRRNFGMISIIGLTCTLMITWEGLLSVFVGELTNGGPTGLIVGYLVSWVGVLAQTLVMAEMGSMIPLSGGQYNWVAILAPRSCYKFLSYLTGWVTVIAWQAVTAGGSLICATLIQGIAVLNNPNYQPARWQATLFYWGITLIALVFNTYLARLLPQVESIILVIHILGFFAVLIPIVYLAPKGSVQSVFDSWENEGGWPTQALSFFVGFVTTMFAYIGIDGATHMAEEIEDASRVIPRAMISSVLINGVLGFAMLLATLFSIVNLQDALNSPTGYPFMEIFLSATNSFPIANALITIIIITPIFATIGCTATTSRMLWAFAREKAVPFSSYISRVEPRTALPLWSIAVTVVVSLLLSLINIASSVAFNALTGLTIAGFYSSFLISGSVLFYKRLTSNNNEKELRWGAFKLGKLAIPVYIISISFSLLGMFFSFWPPTAQINAVTMNYSVVVYVGTILVALVYWALSARHVYTGPIVEVHGR